MGELPVGKIGTVSVRLAGWLEDEDRYGRRYIPVDPDDDRVATDRFAFGVDRQVKVWEQSSWRGGEGERVWRSDSGRYYRGVNVRPGPDGEGLILGPFTFRSRVDTNFDNVSNVDFNPNSPGTFLIDPADTNVWWIDEDEYVEFSTSVDEHGGWFDSGTAVPTGTPAVANQEPTGWANYNSTLVLIAWPTIDTVYTWDPGGAALGDFWTHPGTSGASIRLFGWVGGALLARVGNQIYEFLPDSTAGTETLRDEVGNASGELGAVTDVGVAWLATTPDGKVSVREYNVGADTAATTGQLPEFARPLDMTYAFGFVFVLYQPDSSNEVWLYYQRGGLRGNAGPIRFTDGSFWPFVFPADISSTPRFLPPLGSMLLIYWDQSLWAYNLSEGAFYLLSDSAATITGDVTVTLSLDGRLFVADADQAQIWVPSIYTTRDAYVEHGAVDFQYPGLDKILLDVTVVTDPLPAGTQVTVAVSADEAAYVTLAGAHSTDGETSHTFVASTDTTTISAKQFRIKVIPDTTDEAETPTIRAVSARATGASHRLEWVLQVDCGEEAADGGSAALIDALNLLADTRAVVEFSDPWQNPDHESPDVFDVTVEEVVTPEKYTAESGPQLATVRLKAVTLQ